MIQSEGFRLGIIFTVLFFFLTAALLSAVFWIVEDAQLRTLSNSNQADIAAVENGLREEGPSEALEVVRQMLESSQYPGPYPTRAFIDLEIRDTQAQAGNFHPQGHPTGPVVIAASGYSIVGEGVRVADGVYIFVGRDTRQLGVTRARIVNAFVWISCGALSIASVSGYMFGRAYLRRIHKITQTCQAIMQGRLSERIPIAGNVNELDRLAATINDMLNRIATLLENLQQVSSDVAHDLRTPLARLRNRLEEIDPNAASSAEYAEVVARSLDDVDHLLSLFAAILRVSQIESGTRRARFARQDLADLLRNVVAMYQPVTEDGGQTLSAMLESYAFVHGDRELLIQLFSNLIENAIHHSGKDSRITVELLVQHRSGTTLIVATVSDTGVGIAPEERDKVLRRFYRGTHSRTTAGHGLGLALVSAIANLHQAEVELLDAEPGLLVRLTFAAAEESSAAFETIDRASNVAVGSVSGIGG